MRLKTIEIPKGFIPVMITPFHDDYSIDYERVEHLTDWYIKKGAVGLFANCLSSEMYELSDDERLKLVESIVKTVKKRVPIFATGTLGGSIEKMADFSNQLYKTGINCVIIINSVFVNEQETDEMFIERIEKYLSLTNPFPIGIYECPLPYKRLVSPQALSYLLNSKRLVYLKDTSLNINNIAEKINIAQGYNFKLFDAYIPHAVQSLKVGSAGLSCIQGNYFPELIVWLCKNYDDPTQAGNLKIVQDFFIENMGLMHQNYPISAKYILQKRGLKIGLTTRRGVSLLSNFQKKQLNLLLDKYLILANDIGI
jgi:4-hydroxy-tetrahydrodipicolinate synthase